jgi:hypothetical protein
MSNQGGDMFFPAGMHNALNVVRNYDGGHVDREQVEAALDLYIMIEPDGFGHGGANPAKFVKELANAKQIVRRYGQQFLPCDLTVLQDEFYSFSNSDKYRYTAETISVVRTVLSVNWEGLAGWRD